MKQRNSLSRAPSCKRRRCGNWFSEILETRVLLSTWTVTSTADDGGRGTLRSIVANSAAGDIVGFDATVFDPGTLHTITLSGQPIEVTHSLTVDGPGPSVLQLSGNHASGVLSVDAGANVVISGLAVTGGSASTGAGIVNNGFLTLDNSTVSANSAALQGAGIFNSSAATLIAQDSTISGNTITAGSQDGGGGVYNAGNLTLVDSAVSNNNGGVAFGGGIMNTGTASITDSTIAQNSDSVVQGGGIDNTGALTLLGSAVSSNSLPARRERESTDD